MKKSFSILCVLLLFAATAGITGSQVNEPVKIGIEKIAITPPGIVATVQAQLSDNPAFIVRGDFRLISDYEKPGATKPLALVMAPTASGIADYSAFLYNSSLFLPDHFNQVKSPPV